jgi:type I thyroxine 5'-deiodinase
VPALNDLYRRYRDDVAFYVVYIQEAHPVDAWQMDVNVRERVLVSTSKTLKDRADAAGNCALRLGIELPAIIDRPDDAVERAYTGWPDRLYVIDTDGRIAYKSAAGPFGFKPEDLGPVLQRSINSRR